ncbi:MAG: histone, partial [Burkholderiaceae bacterium]
AVAKKAPAKKAAAKKPAMPGMSTTAPAVKTALNPAAAWPFPTGGRP